MNSTLEGHESAETAYVVRDYPYGFRLRCEMRIWIESNKHGQRVWRQTSNPKRPGAWNKPKAGTYSPILMLRLSPEDHVEVFAPDIYNADALKAFEGEYSEKLSNYQRNAITRLLASHRARKHYSFEIHTCASSPCLDDVHTKSYKEREKEGMAVISQIVRHELRAESNAALAGEPFER